MRNLILDDAKDLEDMRKTSFEDFWSENEFRSMLKDKSFFGFIEDHGFILCRKALDCIDIVTFCVVPEYRQKGIGRQLLNKVIEFAEINKCQIFLEVAENNYSAQGLYRSVGFEEISTRKNYYKFATGFQNALVFRR